MRHLAVVLLAGFASLADFGEVSRAARAGTVTPERAGRVAQGWLTRESRRSGAREKPGVIGEPKILSSGDGHVIGYDFRLPDGGCVVIAADDRVHPVLFSSHVMQEVAALCDRVLIIGHGKVLADMTVQSIRERSGSASLEEAFLQVLGGAEGVS